MASMDSPNRPSASSPHSPSATSNSKTQRRQLRLSNGKKKKEKKEKKKKVDGNPNERKFPRISCFRSTTVETGDGRQSLEMEAVVNGGCQTQTHLVVFINGIIGSASNWRFAAKQFVKRFPEDVIVHCSECNTSTLTFDGVDVMGERLAAEVISVIKRRPAIQKISFVGHSLGGLIARYTVAILYGKKIAAETMDENIESKNVELNAQSLEEKFGAKIAGLEPINFITFATPHLGSAGHKQIPILCGLRTLEKMACRMSSICGRTGKHLCLKDDIGGKPLLLQMASDSGNIKFISALRTFKKRVVYSNQCFDYIVGRKTSSIRRQHELPKQRKLCKDNKYPHIVNVETGSAIFQQEEPLEGKLNSIDMEEAMIRGLNQVSWDRVDVSFRKSKQRFFAHNTIQVKTYFLNSDGADVIFHMMDNFLL